MTDLIGRYIGNYRIEAHLGTGGMAHVYKGIHRFLHRPAAIKVMHDNLAADPEFQARFLQEAKAAAALRHPHIVEIFDFGVEGGRYFLVMELVTHGSLQAQLRKWAREGGDWPWVTCVEYIRQAAEALAHAHERGIIHRDIKPDNLLLTRSLSSGQGALTLKITDFGLARLMKGSILTATGSLMGTPAYMSPEQCEGKKLDARSDIYSLGVVLYEVVTGRRPFTFETPVQALYQHVHAPPVPPRKYRADCPEALEGVILEALAKSPEDRFENARLFAQALSEILAALTPDAPTLLHGLASPSEHEEELTDLGEGEEAPIPLSAERGPAERATSIYPVEDMATEGAEVGEREALSFPAEERRFRLFSRRLVLLSLLLLPLIAAGAFLFQSGLLLPKIEAIGVSPPAPAAGEPVTISWKVEHAGEIALLPFVAGGIDPDEGRHSFTEGFGEAVEITFVARNIFGAVKKPLHLDVVEQPPPTPATQTPSSLEERRRAVEQFREDAERRRIEAIQANAQYLEEYRQGVEALADAEEILLDLERTDDPSRIEGMLSEASRRLMAAKRAFNIATSVAKARRKRRDLPPPPRRALDREDAERVRERVIAARKAAASFKASRYYNEGRRYETLGDEQFRRKHFEQARTFYQVAREKYEAAGKAERDDPSAGKGDGR